MYSWIWRRLPGPRALKVVQVLVLCLITVAALFHWVFPAIEPWVNQPSLPW